FSIHPNITVNNGFSDNESTTESTDLEGTKLNNSTSERHSKVHGINFSNRLDFTRKFGHKGGYFQVGLNNNNSKNKSTRSNFTTRNIFDENEDLKDTDIQDQRIKEDKKGNSYTVDA